MPFSDDEKQMIEVLVRRELMQSLVALNELTLQEQMLRTEALRTGEPDKIDGWFAQHRKTKMIAESILSQLKAT